MSIYDFVSAAFASDVDLLVAFFFHAVKKMMIYKL